MQGAPREGDVASWFDATYRQRGWRYLRPFAAYPILLQILDAPPGAALLDVGCGPGHLLRAAAQRGLVATGADRSLEACRMGRCYVPQAAFVAASSEALPFAAQTFDAVTCIGAIERFLDRERALGEMLRVARDGARFCFMVRNARTLVWMVWHRWLGRRNRQGNQDAATLDEWRRLFARCGLVEEGVWADQWARQKLRRLVRRPAAGGREPIARPLLPLRFANEFIFVLRKRRPGEPDGARAAAGARLHRLYDHLSRYNWLRRRLRRAPPGHGLALRKRLKAVGGGELDLDGWLLDELRLPPRPRVLDLGCGFGATLLAWAKRLPGSFLGLTPIAFQARCARKEAARLGVGDRCTFAVQDLAAPIDGTFDAAVAIESLGHAGEPARLVASLAQAVRPGGLLAIVDDWALDTDVRPDGAARELAARWSLPGLPTAGVLRRALAASGFTILAEHDLTARVAARDEAVLARSERWLRRWRRLVPFAAARDVADAYLGGVALERLYGGGRMRYLAILAKRDGAP